MTLVKYDAGKLRYDLVPVVAERQLASVITFGAQKYWDHGWQQCEPEEEIRYYAALRRHLDAWRRGEQLDPETGLHHLAHALCNTAFLLWFADQRKEVPDPEDTATQAKWNELLQEEK